MKAIDFHIHTLFDTSKDHAFTFSQQWLDEYVHSAELDAIAICNHNVFDTEQFRRIAKATESTVFPGMEVSLLNGHVLVIYDNSTEAIAEIAHASEIITNFNLGPSDSIDIEEFKRVFPDWKNSILVFETTKSNSMAIPDDLREATCLGGVPSPNRFQRELLMGTEVPALFSDAHASLDESDRKRNHIPDLVIKHTFVECDTTSFEDIRRGLQQKSTVGSNKNQVTNIYDVVVDEHPVTVSTGLNLIVGRRGSGKTFLIDSIASGSSDKIYKLQQFDTASNRTRFLERQQAQKGQEAYKKFVQRYQKTWTQINDTLMKTDESDVTDITQYLIELQAYANSYNSRGQASQIGLFNDRPFEFIPQKNLISDLTSLRSLIESKDFWNHVTTAYRETFIKAYTELRSYLINTRIHENQQERVNILIDAVQSEVRRQSGIMKPPTINLTKSFKKNLVQDKTNIFLEKILFSSTDGVTLSREKFGEYQVVVRLVAFEDAKDYQKIMHTSEAVKNKLLIPYREGNFDTYLNNLKTYSFYRPNHLTDYIANVVTTLETAKGNPASGGQQVAFALLMGLEEAKSSDVALIDEPEASLDNHFIKTTLIPKLRELAMHTTTFVITHNSTLGTLLKPNYLIVAKTSDEKKFDYLSGDFKSAKIHDTVGTEFDSIEDFVDAMESGIDTYKEKGEVYGTLSSRSKKTSN